MPSYWTDHLADAYACRPVHQRWRYALTPEEVTRLAPRTGHRYAPMIFTAAMLGLRFCECAALRVGRIDLDAEPSRSRKASWRRRAACSTATRRSRVRGDERCACQGRSSRCSKSHLEAVAINRDDERALVFTSPTGGPLRYSNFRKRVWYPAVERAGLPPIGFHDLRRTAATVLVANNIDMKTAQVRLGHANPALTLKIYAQATTSQDRAAAAMIDSYFVGALRDECFSPGERQQRPSHAEAGEEPVALRE